MSQQKDSVGLANPNRALYGFSDNQRTSRTMDVYKYGDTLLASLYGSKAMITGDMTLDTIQRDASNMPEPMQGHPILNRNEARQRFSVAKRCGSSNADCGEPKGDSYAISFSKEGDATVYHNPQEFYENMTRQGDFDNSFTGGQNFFGGYDPDNEPTSSVLGEQYEQTPVGFLPDWIEDIFKNDCQKVCGEFQGEAKEACLKDCNKSNEGLGLTGSLTKYFVIAGLILAGIAVLYAGLSSVSRGGS